MLVITLGTQASGSTWLFNVVRALFACADRAIFCSSADDGVDALDKMPVQVKDVVLKSHSMDQRLLRIARLARAKLIVSTRDPLDSMVSQQERFAHSSRLAAVDLTRSFATIASLPPDVDKLNYRYEDCFTARKDTVFELARFLGLAVSADQADEIFRTLEPNAVKARLEAAQNPPSAVAPGHDPLTQWHPNHIGDGRVGKWRDRLAASTQAMTAGCLTPLASPDLWPRRPLRWSADVFHYGEDWEGEDAPCMELECDGAGRILVYGPYLHLPCGRWRATPLVEGVSGGLRLEADVNLPNAGDESIATRVAIVHRWRPSDLSLVFDHRDHFQPVEVRLKSLDGQAGRFRFSGCELRWLRPCE